MPAAYVLTVGEAPAGVPVRFTAEEQPATSRFQPAFPEPALAAGLTEGRCLAEVFVGSDGAPYRVSVDGCDPLFRPNSAASLVGWRWPPSSEEARQTVIAVTYRASP